MQPAAASQGKASPGGEEQDLSSRMGLGETGVPSSVTPASPTRGPSTIITSRPVPSATTSREHSIGMSPAGGCRESPAARRGAGHGATGILLLVWICPPPFTRRGEGASPEEEGCIPRKERKCCEEPDGATRAGAAAGTARGTSPGTRHGPGARKKPCPHPLASPGVEGKVQLPPSRRRQGDRWVPGTAGTGRVQGDLRSTKSWLAPFLAPGLGDTSGSSSPLCHAAPDLETPREGDHTVLPPLTAAAQLEGDGAPCTHAHTPSHTSTTAQAWVPARGPHLLQEKVLVDSAPGQQRLPGPPGGQAWAPAWS